MNRSKSSQKMANKKTSSTNIGNSKTQEIQNFSLTQYNKDLEKINNYQKKLESFSQKLKSKKRKFNFLLKENISKLANQETEIESQLKTLSDQIKTFKNQKEKSDQDISQHKLLLIKLEDEKNNLNKTEKWAETTFSNSSNQNSTFSTRNTIFKTLDEIDEIKKKSRVLRSKIFSYQKRLLKLSDDISPVRVQIYLLQSKIDYENENEINNQELSTKTQNTIKAAVAAQHLTIEKMKLQKQIDQINQRISEIKAEKSQIKKKLTPIKSEEKESILKTILEQVNQYEEASLRRKSYQENKIMSIHETISKELEIKIEIDEIQNELKQVKQQKEEMKNVLIQKKTEINTLQNMLATYNVQEVKKDPLYDLIVQIKQKREEGIKIETQEPKEFTIDPNELQTARENCDIQYNELKLVVKKQLDFNEQMKKELIKRMKELESDKKAAPIQKVVFKDTPKISLLKKRINDMEKEVFMIQQKHQKKLSKISKKQAIFNSDHEKLDLDNNLYFLKSEFANYFERSMSWFLQAIRSQIKLWFLQNINIPQTIGKWDSKIISAVINETEDFILKSSILCR